MLLNVQSNLVYVDLFTLSWKRVRHKLKINPGSDGELFDPVNTGYKVIKYMTNVLI